MVDGVFGYPARVALFTGEVRGNLPADAFVFQASVSNGSMDSFYTRMHESSLRNYAADAARGIAFQNSHRHNELPFGRSFAGDYVDGQVVASFYTLRDLNINGVNTNDLIRAIEAGIVSDVSIGFSGGDYRCGICGNDLWSQKCTHVPGIRYEDQLAFAWIENARLAEVSAVYEGATPGAAILKAERMIDAGALKPEYANVIEERYRVKLHGNQRVWVAGKTQEDSVEDVAKLRALLGVAEDVDLVEAVTNVRSERAQAVTELGTLRAKVIELEPLAVDGRAYREDLIGEALAEGVRAMGNDFAQESYRSLLSGSPLSIVKQMRNDWRSLADKQFAGGRESADKAGAKSAPKSEVPNAAFQG